MDKPTDEYLEGIMKKGEAPIGRDPTSTPKQTQITNPELQQAFLEVKQLAESEQIHLRNNMLIAVWPLPFIKHLLGRVQQLEERTALLQGALSHLKERRKEK